MHEARRVPGLGGALVLDGYGGAINAVPASATRCASSGSAAPGAHPDDVFSFHQSIPLAPRGR